MAQLTPWGGEKKWNFFQSISFSLLQATNSHTNEVVAVKKMSYSGKQTNEVRWIKPVLHAEAGATIM